MLVKCHTNKKIYGNDNYSIFSCTLNERNENVVLSSWGNFTIKDTSGLLEERKDYEVELKESVYRDEKQYILVNIPAYTVSVEDITDEKELEILKTITTDSQAKYVHDAYPNFVRLVLSGKKDEIDIKKIYNVAEMRFNCYVREINEKYKYFHVMSKFKEYELSVKDCKELCSMFGSIDEVINQLNKRPYACLIKICGRSFTKADAMILKSRPEFYDCDERVEYAILDVLDANEVDGSTYMDGNEMAEYIYGLEPDMLGKIKDVTVASPLIYYNPEDKSVAKLDTYMAEVKMANFIKDRLAADNVWDFDYTQYKDTDEFRLTDTQLNALKNLCEYDVSLLVGYSGTGKTSSVKAIIQMLEDNGMTYKLLAPTGKAAKRLAESTNRSASTMHRAINGGTLNADVIIVDEFSFFGTEWTNMLISEIENSCPDAKVLFVGDSAQLNPISCGKTLQDLLDSKILPTTLLTEVFRYAEGGISKIATDLRLGVSNLTNDTVQQFGKDYKFINPVDPKAALINEYVNLLERGTKPQEITCISPFNVGEVGCYTLNNEIQSIINPIKPKETFHEYKIKRSNREYIIRLHDGDYVMNTVNDYNAITLEQWNEMIDMGVTEDDMGHYSQVFNGDCGVIKSCDKDKIVVQFDEELIVYPKAKISNLILCMVITTHKVQGSQNKYIINLSLPEHRRMLTRNLLYVANTRATYKHIEIGSPETIASALVIEENKNRKTKLCELLMEVA